jgi:SAM-dependent methyltransferase
MREFTIGRRTIMASITIPDPLQEWLTTPLGASLLEVEQRLIRETLDGLFGEQLLQVGLWGGREFFVSSARTQAAWVVAMPGSREAGDIIAEPARLPVASDSVDVVFLPHTLDLTDHPHAALREVYRVLRADGQLVVLGFRPGGLWALRRLATLRSYPPGRPQMISERQLSDWLRLLDMKIHGVRRYFFRWPVGGSRKPAMRRWEAIGDRWWPELSSCYALTARKQLYTLIPMRRRWRRSARAVGGLVEPTVRALPEER